MGRSTTDSEKKLRGRERREHLIIQTAFLGDLLLSIPLLHHLRELYPHDKITLFCRRGLGEFMLKAGAVDDVVEADKSSKASWNAAVENLSSRHFENLICPHESTRSLLLALRLHARRKIGYESLFGRFVLNDCIRRPLELPEALRQLALLEPLHADVRDRLKAFRRAQAAPGGQGKAGEPLLSVPTWGEMKLPRLAAIHEASTAAQKLALLSEPMRDLAIRHGLLDRQCIFIAPGSVWPTKMWTEEGFTATAIEFAKQGFKIVAMGSTTESEICSRIAARVPGALSLAGKTNLFDSAELLALATVLICNDSGAMHMAATAGVPTVSVFGPTILDFGYRPWQNQAVVLEVPRSEMPCRPCGKHGALRCPLGTHACMSQVPAAAVTAAAKNLANLRHAD